MTKEDAVARRGGDTQKPWAVLDGLGGRGRPVRQKATRRLAVGVPTQRGRT